MPKFQARKKGYYNQRHKIYPKLPKTIEEIILPEEYKQTVDRKRYLLWDKLKETNKSLAMASDNQIYCLGMSKVWHVDGTFKTSPNLFYRTFIIHGWYLNEMHQCVHIYLDKKTKSAYLECFNELNKQIKNLNPEMILCDFELATINALRDAFPKAIIKGCFFHFAQALWRNVQLKGLSSYYKDNYEVYKWLQLF